MRHPQKTLISPNSECNGALFSWTSIIMDILAYISPLNEASVVLPLCILFTVPSGGLHSPGPLRRSYFLPLCTFSDITASSKWGTSWRGCRCGGDLAVVGGSKCERLLCWQHGSNCPVETMKELLMTLKQCEIFSGNVQKYLIFHPLLSTNTRKDLLIHLSCADWLQVVEFGAVAGEFKWLFLSRLQLNKAICKHILCFTFKRLTSKPTNCSQKHLSMLDRNSIVENSLVK